MYTNSEKTVKKYTVFQAIESAKRRLGEKFVAQHGVCCNATSQLNDSDMITLVRLNEISDKIYHDSLYHTGH